MTQRPPQQTATTPGPWPVRMALGVTVLVGGTLLLGLYHQTLDRARAAYVEEIGTVLDETARSIEAFRVMNGRVPAAVPQADVLDPDLSRPGQRTAARRTTIDPGDAARAGLTRPVNFVEAIPLDYFAHPRGLPLAYHEEDGGWLLWSAGPDERYDIDPARDYSPSMPVPLPSLAAVTYDPTNGLASSGDIWRAAPARE